MERAYGENSRTPHDQWKHLTFHIDENIVFKTAFLNSCGKWTCGCLLLIGFSYTSKLEISCFLQIYLLLSRRIGRTVFSLKHCTAVVDESEMYKYELFHINFTSFHCTGRYEINKLTSLPMRGFIAQLVEHRTGIAEVMGSNPVEALIFSGFFFPIA